MNLSPFLLSIASFACFEALVFFLSFCFSLRLYSIPFNPISTSPHVSFKNRVVPKILFYLPITAILDFLQFSTNFQSRRWYTQTKILNVSFYILQSYSRPKLMPSAATTLFKQSVRDIGALAQSTVTDSVQHSKILLHKFRANKSNSSTAWYFNFELNNLSRDKNN